MTFIVTTPNRVMETAILKGLAYYTTRTIQKSIPKITQDIKDLVVLELQLSSTYSSLLGGDLRKDFGIPAGEEISRVSAVVNTIAQNISVEYVNSYFGGIRVGILKKGFADILNLPASVIHDAKNHLPWLDWLLIQGDTIIVSDFVVKYGQSAYSRSGDAVMIESIGGYWKVDSRFSGTEQDNWLTRTLGALDNEIGNIMHKYLY